MTIADAPPTTPPQQLELEPVVPPGVDPLDELSVRELDVICQQLGCDVMEALAGARGLRWAAMARLAHTWALRRDPTAQLATYQNLKAPQLTAVLRLEGSRPAPPAEPAVNPTAPARG